MKQNVKIFFCFICCFLGYLLSLITLLITNEEIQELKQNNQELTKQVKTLSSDMADNIKKQNRQIELDKIYVDDIVRNITNGNW